MLTLTVTAITLFGWTSVNDWSKLINQKLYDDPIIFEASTPYQQITMTEGQHPTNPYDSNYELYLNGNKQFSSVDEHIYHELLVHPAMSAAASRKNVLVLGGGDGLAMREILKYPDVEHVTLVDLDPAMIEIARTNPVLTQLNEGSFDDARVNVDISEGVIDTGQTRDVIVDTNQADSTECSIVSNGENGTRSECTTLQRTESIGSVDIYTVDADTFVSTASGPWDVVIVDLPDPNSVELAKLYSAEFYGKIRQNMSIDGIVVVQSTSPYHAKETFLCILRTMSAAGFGVTPYHANVPSFGDWGWIIGSPSLSDQRMRESLEQVEFTVDTQEIDTQVLRSALTFNKTSLVSQNSSISTLMNPTIFQYYDYEGWKSE